MVILTKKNDLMEFIKTYGLERVYFTPINTDNDDEAIKIEKEQLEKNLKNIYDKYLSKNFSKEIEEIFKKNYNNLIKDMLNVSKTYPLKVSLSDLAKYASKVTHLSTLHIQKVGHIPLFKCSF